MAETITEVDAPVAAQKAYNVLVDFPNFLVWNKIDADIKIEGKGLGTIRRMDLPGFGKIAEQLDHLDPAKLEMGYTLVDGQPLGMKTYVCRVKITPTGDNSCHIRWHGTFTSDDEATTREGMIMSYEGMTNALVAYIQEQG